MIHGILTHPPTEDQRRDVLLRASPDCVFRLSRRLDFENAQGARARLLVRVWLTRGWYSFGRDRTRRVQALGTFLFPFSSHRMRYFSRDDVFLSSFSRSVAEEQLARQKQKRAHTRQRKEFARRVLSFFPSLIQNGGGRGNQFPLLFSLIFPYLKEGPFLDFFKIFFFRLKKTLMLYLFLSFSLLCARVCV